MKFKRKSGNGELWVMSISLFPPCIFFLEGRYGIFQPSKYMINFLVELLSLFDVLNFIRFD